MRRSERALVAVRVPSLRHARAWWAPRRRRATLAALATHTWQGHARPDEGLLQQSLTIANGACLDLALCIHNIELEDIVRCRPVHPEQTLGKFPRIFAPVDFVIQ